MRHLTSILIASLFAICTSFAQEEVIIGPVIPPRPEAKIGEPLPLWQEGELDINLISTGRGESTFLIFPDGTTFLVDASGVLNKKSSFMWRPNADVTTGQAIVDYINHFSPAVSEGHINYFLVTHHHGDHMGAVNGDVPWHSSNQFQLSSACEIGSKLVMDRIFDRDYPDFSYPTEATSEMMTNYRKFLDWTRKTNKTKIEKWAVGSRRQVVLQHDKTYDFSIRNLAGNGCRHTGVGTESAPYIPSKQALEVTEKGGIPNENCFSCAFILSYGNFDYYAGGDLQYADNPTEKDNTNAFKTKYPYLDAEAPLVGLLHKVEVAKANHHGVSGSQSAEFINKLAPDVWLVGVWFNTRQPDPGPTARVIEANPNVEIFCTYQSDENLGRLAEKIGKEETDRHIAGRYGHVVVRVANGGDSYMVYTLEDSDEEYKVKSIHGPYQCVGRK